MYYLSFHWRVPFLFGTLFSFIINLGPCGPVSVHSDRYNQSSAHVRPVNTIINISKYSMCLAPMQTFSIIGMAQDLFGLLTKLIITIMYIVKYLWFSKSYIVHFLLTICVYILYYMLTHVFMYSETSCSSSSNNHFSGCFTDAARQKVIRHFLYSIYMVIYLIYIMGTYY